MYDDYTAPLFGTKKGAPGNPRAPKPDKSCRGSFVLLQFATKTEDDGEQAMAKHGASTTKPDIVNPIAAMTLPMNMEPRNIPTLCRAGKGRRGTRDEVRGHHFGASRPQHCRDAATYKTIQDDDDDV